MAEKDEIKRISLDDHDSDDKEISENLSQLIVGEGSSSSCSIPQEDEDKAASTNQETSSSDSASASVVVEEPQENIQQQEEQNEEAGNQENQEALLEVTTVLSFVIDQFCATISAILISLMDKIYAMIALEQIYLASRDLLQSHGSELETIIQRRELLEQMVENHFFNDLQRQNLQEALGRCMIFESILRQARTITQNETRVLNSILYGNNTQQGLAELHAIHQQLMIVGNGLMDQLQIARELSDEMMEMVVDEMIALQLQ